MRRRRVNRSGSLHVTELPLKRTNLLLNKSFAHRFFVAMNPVAGTNHSGLVASIVATLIIWLPGAIITITARRDEKHGRTQ
jgi:hypothetical protein